MYIYIYLSLSIYIYIYIYTCKSQKGRTNTEVNKGLDIQDLWVGSSTKLHAMMREG